MPQAFNRIRVTGTLPGGEVWSVNPTFMGNFASLVNTYDELQAWATAVAGLYQGAVVPESLRRLLSSACSITTIRAEYYGADGVLADAAEAGLATPSKGPGEPTKPYQIALVLSILSGRPGRSYRGRLYWPALGATFATGTIRLDAAVCQTIATETAQWLSAIANAAPGDASILPAIVSQTLGVNTAATQVRVGDVLDTQRRRRDALTEVTRSAQLVP